MSRTQHHGVPSWRRSRPSRLGVVTFADDCASSVTTGDHPNGWFPVDLDARIGLVTLGVPVRQSTARDLIVSSSSLTEYPGPRGMQSSHVVFMLNSVPRASPISEDWASSNPPAGGENSTWTAAFTISKRDHG